MKDSKFYLIGCASGIAGADEHSGDGPLVLRQSARLTALRDVGIDCEWKEMLVPEKMPDKRVDEQVAASCHELAVIVSALVKDKHALCVVGGDHSCAIGTWSGVYDAVNETGDLGLIWVDAHMDSHTPETTPSGNIHGMPLAVLLGHGYSTLTSILHAQPKFKPQNVCLVGVRSFEPGEAALLSKLNVRVFFMEEIKEKGLEVVMREAVEHVTKHTVAYGITIDIDSVDPADAPGVDVPEADGIRGVELCAALGKIATDTRLIAAELVEFDPGRDIHHKTENLMADLIKIIVKGSVRK